MSILPMVRNGPEGDSLERELADLGDLSVVEVSDRCVVVRVE